jgi:hypothetical protein
MDNKLLSKKAESMSLKVKAQMTMNRHYSKIKIKSRNIVLNS